MSKEYSEFVGPKHKSDLAAQKVFWQNTFESVLDFQNTFKSVLLWLNTLKFICWACSSVSERNYFNDRKYAPFFSPIQCLPEDD